MVDYAARLGSAPSEWLTVAARDNETPRLAPADTRRADDLHPAHHRHRPGRVPAGQISRDEARKRVQVQEF